MIRLTILTFTLLCSVSVLNARTIQGIVLSSNDSTAVAGASCRLLSDGRLITGASTGADGSFSLETGLKSALNLEISMTGYSPTDVIIEPGGRSLNIGTVYLDDGVTLDEVTVTGILSSIRKDARLSIPPARMSAPQAPPSVCFRNFPFPDCRRIP